MQAIFKPCLFSTAFTNIEASIKDSFVPISNQAKPLLSISKLNLFSFKYNSFIEVISNSPLFDGLIFGSGFVKPVNFVFKS